MAKKPIHCTKCGSDYHYQSFCPLNRKPIRAIVGPRKVETTYTSSKPLQRATATHSRRKQAVKDLDSGRNIKNNKVFPKEPIYYIISI